MSKPTKRRERWKGPRDEVRLSIRTCRVIRQEFKKIAVEFGSYDKAIRAFVRVYQEHPEYFPEVHPKPKPLER